MRAFLKIGAVIAMVMTLFSVGAFAQTPITRTTLSAAVNDERVQFFTVASATGFVASTNTVQYGAFIDHEFFLITSVSGTRIGVQRGYSRTSATPHKSGTSVFTGVFASQASPNTAGGPFIQTQMSGSCTRSAYPVLPLINVEVGSVNGQMMYNCLDGKWFAQSIPGDSLNQLTSYSTVPIGSVAYGSFGTATTLGGSGYLYVGSVSVPGSQYFTGVKVLQNGTVGTNLLIGALYDAGGVLLANSALAGTVTVGANTFLSLPFTTPYLATGPARYFIAIQGNGVTDGIRTVATSTFINLLSTLRASGTFGTLGTFTVPTTFTADQAPIAAIY